MSSPWIASRRTAGPPTPPLTIPRKCGACAACCRQGLGALRHAHTPAERHDGDDQQGEADFGDTNMLAQKRGSRSERHKRLQQLQLAHSGDAADRQAFVPHEEAQEHAEADTYRKPAHAEALAPQLMGGDSSTSTSMTGAENTSAQEITSQPPMRRAISPPSA